MLALGGKENINQRINEMTFAKPTFTEIGAASRLITLRSDDGKLEMAVTNYGGKIVSLKVPSKDSQDKPAVDVVTGYDSLETYYTGQPYFGAVIGRVGNRIAKGNFTIPGEGKAVQLPSINNGENHLHGGLRCFSNVNWEVAEETASKLVLKYTSEEGEEGYPGRMEVTNTYEL